MTQRNSMTRWSAAPGLALLVSGLLVADASTASTPTQAGRVAAARAQAGTNRIDGLNMVEGDDGTTTVRLKGSASPTYNVYRLQGPDRLVVDVSSGSRGKVVPRVTLDTWAVGQVSVDEVSEGGANLVRVTFGLKRDASYIVVPDGADLVVTVTPREVPPEAYFARKSASKRRSEIEQAESRVSELESRAAALRAQAQAQVDEAKARAAEARKAERRAREAEARARAQLEGASRGRGKVRRALREAEKERAAAEKVRKEAEAALRQALARATRQRKEAAQMHAAARRKLAKADHTLKLARAKKSRADQALAQANASKAAASRALSEAARKREEAEQALAQAQQTLARARKAREEAERAAKTRASRRTKEALARAREAEAAARTSRERADQELTAARAEVAKLRRLAAQDREAARVTLAAAAADKRHAEEALAEARKAKARAQQTLAQARKAREEAERAAKKRASRRAKEALARARKAEAAARARQQQADQELALARAEVARLRQQAEADREQARATRQAADADKRHAEQVLAEATLAMQQAQAEKEAAARARKEAEAALARARAAARKGKKGAKGSDRAARKEIERALTQARQAEQAARRRYEQAQKNLAELRADRGRLAKMLEEQRELNAKLVASRAKERASRDQAEREQLARVRKEIAAESQKLQRLEKRVLGAQRELDERLARLEAERAASEQANLSREWKKARKAAGRTTVKDVKFEDGARASRVVVRYDGPVEYEGAQLTPNVFMLRLSDAKIAKQLERSLDASSYAGPIQTITSFGEGDEVKILVSTREDVQPKVREGKGALVWTFPRTKPAPRPQAVSVPGSKVGGYAKTPAPLMAAASPPSRAEAPASSGSPPRRARRGRRGKWRGERIDIELQDAPIKDVLLLFSDIGRVNIIAGQGVSGSVTMKLTAVPWDQALDIILRSLGLGMVREGNVIRVATQQSIEEERRKAVEQAAARVQLKPLETRLVPVSYATVDEMIPKVQSVLSPRGSVTPDSRTNTLIIMDVAENIALAEQLVGQLDSQTPQVLIEARIVEARTSFLRQLGIQWGLGFIASPGTGNPTGLLFPNSIGIGGGASGRPPDTRGLLLPGVAQNPNYAVDLPAPVGTGAGGALGFSFGNISGNLQTNLRLSAAEDTGEVRIISAPKIVTLDNTEAQIEQGVQIPISQVSAQGVNTRYVRATLGLRVTPHVTNEGAVLLEVNVQKNEADFVNTGARGDPTILTKQAESRMLVNDGDTAVIGGIYTRNKSVNFKKVPWIADIPIIGWFFKNKTEADTRTEVLIFLTPKIVNRASSIGG